MRVVVAAKLAGASLVVPIEVANGATRSYRPTITSISASQTTITVHWTIPAGAPLAPITPFLVGATAVRPTYERTGWMPVLESLRSGTLTDLASGTTYVVTVQDALKEKSRVVVKDVTKDVRTSGPVTRIFPPRILSVTATSTTITVKWDPGVNTTRQRIWRYHVEATGGVNNSRSSPWSALPSTARSFVVTALTPGTRYAVHVDAYSRIGLPGSRVMIVTKAGS
jgi:hypothetical protein